MIDRRQLLLTMAGAGLGACLPEFASAEPLEKVKALGVLRVAIYKDNRPWSWRGEDGSLIGIDADIGKALAEQLGVKVDLAELVSDESVDDDLRNAVSRGGRLGFQPADVMLHVPFDRTFAARNDQVAFIAPYYRETFRLACGADTGLDCEAQPRDFRGHNLAVELDSIPDYYFLGSFGGLLAKDVKHFRSGTEAVDAVVKGRADVALTTSAQLENGVKGVDPALYKVRKGPIPLMLSPGWDVGMAVKENSRNLGDALESIMEKMVQSGQLASIFANYGVKWAPASVGG